MHDPATHNVTYEDTINLPEHLVGEILNDRLQDDGHWLLLDTLKESDPVKQPPFGAITFALESLWA